jgi:hypothetical protein
MIFNRRFGPAPLRKECVRKGVMREVRYMQFTKISTNYEVSEMRLVRGSMYYSVVHTIKDLLERAALLGLFHVPLDNVISTKIEKGE